MALESNLWHRHLWCSWAARDNTWLRIELTSKGVVFSFPVFTFGAVVQFLYDLWWGHITPDTDFPKDVRRVLNSAFGELAVRAQQADLKRMLLTYACCLNHPPAKLSTVLDTMPWCMHQHASGCLGAVHPV